MAVHLRANTRLQRPVHLPRSCCDLNLTLKSEALAVTRTRARHPAWWILALCLAIPGQPAAQERDRVSVKFFPSAGRLDAYEPMDVQIERLRSPAKPGVRDGLFERIDKTLATHGITSNWQYVYPDGAFIRISIEIGGRRIELASAHTLYERGGRHVALERGLVALDGRDPKQVLAEESEAFRNRRLAFEKILALVSAQVQENLRQ